MISLVFVKKITPHVFVDSFDAESENQQIVVNSIYIYIYCASLNLPLANEGGFVFYPAEMTVSIHLSSVSVVSAKV